MELQREIFTYISIVAFLATQLLFLVASDDIAPNIGVCYGTIANNLPSPPDVVNLFKIQKIFKVRIYEPNPDILNALRGSKEISVTIGTRNEDISSLASSPEAATTWINTNIIPYINSVAFNYVLVGNEVIPGPYAAHVAPAMTNMISALKAVGLSHIRVSTTTYYNLQTSFPPSAGAFPPDIVQIMQDVTHVLRTNANHTSLLVSCYPYVAYVRNLKDISLEYATFRAQTPVMDGPLQYFNLLDAQIDAYHSALEKIGAGDIGVLVTETGWPTAGNEPHTSVENAHLYNSNLYKRVISGKGTPKLPDVPVDAYIFSMFDENLKPVGTEQHWGLFTPNMEQKYPLTS